MKSPARWTPGETEFLLRTVNDFGKHQMVMKFVARNIGKSVDACRRKHYIITKKHDVIKSEQDNLDIKFEGHHFCTPNDVEEVKSLDKIETFDAFDFDAIFA